MSVWASEAKRHWTAAWIGGAGPFACVVTYHKAASVRLFTKADDADRHKHRLDSLEPSKKRWRATEVVNLKTFRAQRLSKTSTPGQR